MTKAEFQKMFQLFKCVIARDSDDLLSFAPSAHLIEHCGGYELELHPSRIVWDKDVACLSLIADKLCCSVECRFRDGSIIVR